MIDEWVSEQNTNIIDFMVWVTCWYLVILCVTDYISHRSTTVQQKAMSFEAIAFSYSYFILSFSKYVTFDWLLILIPYLFLWILEIVTKSE